MVWMGLCRREGANADVASNIRLGTISGSGLSNGVTDPVTLKVLSWDMAGLSEESTDIFLSQISMLTVWDVSENWMQ